MDGDAADRGSALDVRKTIKSLIDHFVILKQYGRNARQELSFC